MSAPLSPLELGLECLKSITNAQFDFLQRLYDRRSIIERYDSIDIELHVHFLSGQGMFCAKYIRRLGGRVSEDAENLNVASRDKCRQLPVLVSIRQITKPRRPLASLVRLHQLYCCDMAAIEALEPSSLTRHSNPFLVSSIGNCVPFWLTPESSLASSKIRYSSAVRKL